MSELQGLRQRRNKPSKEDDNTNEAYEDRGGEDYGYAGSDNELDERLNSGVKQKLVQQEDDDFDTDDREEDSQDESDQQYAAEDADDDDGEIDLRTTHPHIPQHLLDAPKEDDTAVLVAGIVGFFLSLICAGLMPTFGVPQDYVMAGGMLALLTYIMWVSFCPSCGESRDTKRTSASDSISPQVVFVCAACLGTMMGGLLGGGIKYAFPRP